MFEVRAATAELLYQAQQRALKRRLRLDISSRCRPTDFEQPFDVCCARVAIGERTLQVAFECAVDAVLLSDRSGFLPDAVPPPPDPANLLRLMPSPDRFEPFVVFVFDRVFGLDAKSPSYQPALASLGADFFRWGQTAEAKEDFVVNTERGELFIRCKPPPPPLLTLEPADKQVVIMEKK
jgi:hypothetical protein